MTTIGKLDPDPSLQNKEKEKTIIPIKEENNSDPTLSLVKQCKGADTQNQDFDLNAFPRTTKLCVGGFSGLVLYIVLVSLVISSYGFPEEPGYYTGILFGLYITAYAFFLTVGIKSKGQLYMTCHDSTYTFTYNMPVIVAIVDCLMGISPLVIVILAGLVLGPHWSAFNAINSISLMVSIIFIVKGVLNLIQQLCTPWLADKDAVMASIEGRKYVYMMYLGLVLVLSIISILSDLYLIVHRTNLQHNARISCVGVVVVTCILFGCIIRPRHAHNYLVAVLGLCTGLYFAVLGSYSLKSLLSSGVSWISLEPVLTSDTTIAYMFMHLIPIPVIRT